MARFVSLVLAVCLMAASVFAGIKTVETDPSIKNLPSYTAEQISEAITAINAVWCQFQENSIVNSIVKNITYSGNITEVQQIVRIGPKIFLAKTTGSPLPDLVGINNAMDKIQELLKEDHHTLSLGFEAWPSPYGIVISCNAMAEDPSNDSPGATSYKLATTNFILNAKINTDPDADKTKSEMMEIYGFNTLRNCSKMIAQKSAIFFKTIEEGGTPYIITEKSCTVITSGQCYGNNFDLGDSIVTKAADVFGNNNGIATPWEIENLDAYLPEIHVIATGKDPKTLIFQNIDRAKAKLAHPIIKLAPTMSECIKIY